MHLWLVQPSLAPRAALAEYFATVCSLKDPDKNLMIANQDKKSPAKDRSLRDFFGKILSRPERRTAALPVGLRVYAVGDIHGRLDLLDALHDLIEKDSRDGPNDRILIYVGDYIDRGPDSKGVIDRLLAPPLDGFSTRHLRGNHDQSLLDFLDDPMHFRLWKDYGARETLQSYGVSPPRFDKPDAFATARDELEQALPAAHLNFLNGLKLSTEVGDYFFAHAGVRPGLPLAKQAPDDLMWIREEFLYSNSDFGKVVVHGHTPSPEPQKRHNRIGIDTGAYATGRLTCVVLEGQECRFLSTGLTTGTAS